MKKIALAALVLTAASAAQAAGFQAAAWAPDAQLVPASQDINGVSLNIYGANANLNGASIGFASDIKGDVNGVQFMPFIPAIYNHVGGRLNGYQAAIVNQYGTKVNGVSLAVVNYSTATDPVVNGAQFAVVNWDKETDINGAQLGFVNRARNVTGAQIGLVNFSEHLVGVQIGLWNMVLDRSWGDIGNKGLGRGFPFINLGW